MAINWPTSLDSNAAGSFPAIGAATQENASGYEHHVMHSNVNEAVLALEAKVGIGASPASAAAARYGLMADGAGTTTWRALVEADISDLGSYATSSHTHALDDLSDVDTTGVDVDYVIKWSGSAWVVGAQTGGGSSFDPSAVTESIIPDTDSAYDIGSTTLQWATGYFDTLRSETGALAIETASGANAITLGPGGTPVVSVTSSSIEITKDMDPVSTAANIALGSSSKAYQGVCVSVGYAATGDLALLPGNATTYQVVLDSAAGAHEVKGDWLPQADSTWDLGSSSLKWAELFVDNITLQSGGVIRSDGSVVYYQDHIYPSSDATYNLGASTSRWGSVYAQNVYAYTSADVYSKIEPGYIRAHGNRTSSYGPAFYLHHGDIANDPQWVIQHRGALDATYVDDLVFYRYDGSTFIWSLTLGSGHAGNPNRSWRHFVPAVDSTYSLGTSALRWNDIYGDFLTVHTAQLGPWTANGSYAALEHTGYTTGAAYMIMSLGQDTYISAETGYDIFLRPNANDTTYQVQLSDNGWHVVNCVQTAFNGHIRPYSTNVSDIGSTASQFLRVYSYGFQWQASGVETAHTTAHRLSGAWTAQHDRFYVVPYNDGTAKFGEEWGYDFANERWYGEGTWLFDTLKTFTVSPRTDSSYDLGTSSEYYRTAYLDNIVMAGVSAGRGVLDVERETSTATSSVSSETDVTNLVTSSISVLSGRRYRLHWSLMANASSTAGVFVVRLYRTVSAVNTLIEQWNFIVPAITSNHRYTGEAYYDATGTAAHTFKLTIEKTGGGTVSTIVNANYPSIIVVEDVGDTTT